MTDWTTQGSRRKQMAYRSWAIQGKFNESLIYKYVSRTPRQVTGLVLGTLLGLEVGREELTRDRKMTFCGGCGALVAQVERGVCVAGR